MKRAPGIVAFVVLTLIRISPALTQPIITPVWLNGQHYGSTGSEVGLAAAVDPAGNTYVTGYIGGTCTFGGANLSWSGGNDIFVAKYDKNGAHVWSKSFGEAGNEQGNAIAVDISGNVFVTGSFSGTVNFGGSNLVSAGGTDIFVLRLTSAGAHFWSYRYGSTGNDSGNGITLDNQHFEVTGSFSNSVDFGNGVPAASLGGTDVFLARYDKTTGATLSWVKTVGGTSNDIGFGVTADASANVYMIGNFLGTANFGGSNLVSAGQGDIVIAKYNSSGTHQWSNRYGGALDDAGLAVALDPSANVVMTGYSRGNVNFGTGTLSGGSDGDAFLVKLDNAGVTQWARLLRSSALDSGYGVATDDAANVYACGTAGGPINFGTSIFQTTSGSGRDIYLAKYDASGKYQWSMIAGSSNDDNGLGIAVDATRHVHLTGYFSNGVDLGGGSMSSVGAFDFFFANFSGGGALPRINAITDVGNDQGRLVRIDFNRTGHDDALSANTVTGYEAFRRNDAPPSPVAGAAMAPGQRLAGGWTQVGSVSAHGDDHYSIDVPTVGDSTLTLGQYLSVFFIRAATATPTTFFDSPADSGYSVDNLAPGIPGSFAFSAGSLTWQKSNAADFDYFTVYGSNVNSFGSATLVNYTVGTNLDVSGSPYVYYFVTATDFSGNEGKPAVVNTLSGVGGTPQSYVLSVSNYPNPFNPRTTVRYTAPSPGEVKVQIYDARGALIRTLVDAHRAAGAYSTEWDGRDDRGDAVASGVYFTRVSENGVLRIRKMTLLK